MRFNICPCDNPCLSRRSLDEGGSSGLLESRRLHINRGRIKVGEELVIEAFPSGERFQTIVSDTGNKLRARGEIARFYRDAKVNPDDYVLLTEETPGHWTLKKAPSGEYSRYA